MYVRHEVTTQGLVIARMSAGEGSLRVLVYTEALGLVTALAKSAREERSKLRAHLQAGTIGTFAFVKGRDFWRVIGATETENVYFALEGDAAGKEAAARTLAAVRQFVHGAVADPYLWQALSGFAHALSVHRTKLEVDPRTLEYLAVFRLLASLGYVRERSTTGVFLETGYDTETLARAASARTALAHAVNEAIAASGL